MAKKTTTKPAPKPAKPGTAVATTSAKGRGNVPAHIKAGGRGLSKDQADNTIPLIYMLQPMSPQVLKKNNAYIEGAEAGDIWLRKAVDPIVKAEDGFIFQFCHFSKDWVEWVPRDDGGGMVGRTEKLPADHKEVKDKKNPKRITYKSPRDTDYVETRYHVGLVYRDGYPPMPFVIPLSSTGHQFSKDQMFYMNQKGVDSWSSKYLIKSEAKSNDRGSWFNFKMIEDLGWVTEEEEAAGEALYNAFSSGTKTMEDLDGSVGETRAGDDDKM